MVIENDDAQRAAVEEVFQNAGYSTISFENGKRALDHLVTTGNRLPDLIVLDLDLPIVGGWEFLEIVKSYARLSQIPVIVTGGEPPMILAKDQRVHQAFIAKPLSASALLDTAEKLVGKP
ncbi:MAG: response regulator [Deltaproteobacteria bacterium]|nr:response regulator [Deltaproteobacteria bacterium]